MDTKFFIKTREKIMRFFRMQDYIPSYENIMFLVNMKTSINKNTDEKNIERLFSLIIKNSLIQWITEFLNRRKNVSFKSKSPLINRK